MFQINICFLYCLLVAKGRKHIEIKARRQPYRYDFSVNLPSSLPPSVECSPCFVRYYFQVSKIMIIKYFILHFLRLRSVRVSTQDSSSRFHKFYRLNPWLQSQAIDCCHVSMQYTGDLGAPAGHTYLHVSFSMMMFMSFIVGQSSSYTSAESSEDRTQGVSRLSEQC